ncbi:MAG TPA: GNAT family N-acetyltransferase [Candidatus Bathyarchaeia archaeon]|nr:GNAT family N-acetyltransferase [Candidatus Bathyarchaeia archaeon]
MMTQQDIAIVDVPKGKRASLKWILEESFEGWYLMHSKRTLRDIDLVRAATSSGTPVGLVMLKTLGKSVGYVYYIAVAKADRKKGIGKLLLEDALSYFKTSGAEEVFASVEEDNKPSEALFASEGFAPTSFSKVSKKYGSLHTLNMYREMLVVPGEVLLRKAIT